MKTIRSNCFETNSSSTHSVTIDNSSETTHLSKIKNKKIKCAEFGWEYEKFNDFETKASYFWTLVNQDEDIPNLREYLDEIAEEYGFILVKPREDSYVDHGTEHYENFIEKYPKLKTKKGLAKFLFNKNSWIFLGNDNSETYDLNFHLTPNEAKGCKEKVVVGNQFKLIKNGSNKEHIHQAVFDTVYAYVSSAYKHSQNYIDIVNISNGNATVNETKYDYALRKTVVVKEFEVEYKIESNE